MILHADVDAFYAAVAQRDDPALRGRPVVVGAGVVMAASYEARAHGIHGGMGGARARRLCPGLIAAAPDWPAYVQAGRAVFALFEASGALVEPGSMEEAFLDVGADAGAAGAAALAERLRRDVRDHVGLALSVGVARSKVLAKLASREAKPDGLVVVRPEDELAFLHPLPVERVWGVGPATARRLRARGVATLGQAAALSEPELVAVLGRAAGRYVFSVAHNRDERPVRRRRPRRSFGAQRALGRARRERAELEAVLADLAGRVCARMEDKGRSGRTVVLRLRYGDYTRATRSLTLPRATADPRRVAWVSCALLDAAIATVERRGLTLLGLTVTNLAPSADTGQLGLPLERA